MEHKSFWELKKAPVFAPLNGDTRAHAVIVGGGLCGLLCAYSLYHKGVRDIAIIEANEICSGVTAHTTAKITSQHGLLCTKLLKGLGAERAAQYLSANENAVRRYRDIISREHIDCDFVSCNAWVYAAHESDAPSVDDEVTAVRKLGFRADFDTKTELPFPVLAAIKFPDQARFHPLKFAFRLCDILAGAGCKIYTHTKATAAEAGVVHTNRGAVRAEHILSCTHYPFIDKASLLFTRIFQDRSYVLALKNAGAMRDMYLDCRAGGFSFRGQADENREDMILFGAYDHKTGHEEQKQHYDNLRRYARKAFPQGEPAYMWSAQDCMTHDKIPYIGRYPSAGENIYVAAGFNKWGMTSAMAAADILSDLITTGRSDCQDAFRINRGDIGLQAKSFVKETADIAGNFLTHLTAAEQSLRDIHENQGGIVAAGGKRVGVYRDHDGQIHGVKPVCTHMGCAVKWNKDENTWDCTCHGSRFGCQGQVLGGPALQPLEQVGVQAENIGNTGPTGSPAPTIRL